MLLFGSKHDIKYRISMYGAFNCFYLVLNMIKYRISMYGAFNCFYLVLNMISSIEYQWNVSDGLTQ